MKKYILLIILGLTLLGFNVHLAKAMVIDYFNPAMAGTITWSSLYFAGSPTPSQTYVVGSQLPVGIWANTWNYPSYIDPKNCKNQPISGTQTDFAWIVVSDGPPKDAATLAKTITPFNASGIINAQFFGRQFRYLGRIDGTLSGQIAPIPNKCNYQYWVSISGSKTTPTDLPTGQYSLYAILATPPSAVFHETVNLTNVSYSLSVNPSATTIAPNSAASYNVSVIPQRFTSYVASQPATFWTADTPNPAGLPYSSTPTPYWDSPVYNSQYKPGDTIHLAAGNTAPALTTGGSPKCTPTAGTGVSIAGALISDGLPSNVATLTPLNISTQFAGSNYRSLGQLTSADSWLILKDCSVTFNATASGDKIIPTNAAICGPNGSLVPLTTWNNGHGKGHVNLFVIFEGDVGTFVGFQEIVITDTPLSNPPTSMPSIFNSPVNLSAANMTLDPSYFNPPTYNPANPVSADMTSLSYPQTTMNIQTKSPLIMTELCPSYYGTPCYPMFGEGACWATLPSYPGENFYCGPSFWQLVPTPPAPGTYTFNVRGVSGLPLPGIQQLSDQLRLIISKTPPPPPTQITGISASCPGPTVTLKWNPVSFDLSVPGGKGFKIYRLMPQNGSVDRVLIATLPPSATSYLDSGPLSENSIYGYIVTSYNGNGSNDSPTVPVRTLICPSAPATNLTATLNPSTIYAGTPVTLNGMIKNSGTGDFTTSFNNRFDIDPGTGSYLSLPLPLPIPSLGAGMSQPVSAIWQNPTLGTHTIRLCANRPPDPSGITDNTGCDTKLVNVSQQSSLQISCQATPTTITNGSPVTWKVVAITGGNPPYPSVNWVDSDGNQGTGLSWTFTYNLPPGSGSVTKTATVTVRDSTGTSNTCTAQVNVSHTKIIEVPPR